MNYVLICERTHTHQCMVCVLNRGKSIDRNDNADKNKPQTNRIKAIKKIPTNRFPVEKKPSKSSNVFNLNLCDDLKR